MDPLSPRSHSSLKRGDKTSNKRQPEIIMTEYGRLGRSHQREESSRSYRVEKPRGQMMKSPFDQERRQMPPIPDKDEKRMYEKASNLATRLMKTAHWGATSQAIPSPKGVNNGLPNIILFGTSGVGKSSVVNMLDGQAQAVTGNSASGITMHAESYVRRIGSRYFNVFDTAGLNEGSEGSVQPEDAAVKLWDLIKSLNDGVHLLVFVVRDRITASTPANYKLFYKSLCDKKVPIIMVNTGFDFASNWVTWWQENQKHFDKHNMKFDGQVSITSGCNADGIAYVKDRYEISKRELECLILESYEKDKAWTVEDKSWYERVLLDMLGFFRGKNPDAKVAKALKKYCQVPTKIAAQRILEARTRLETTTSTSKDDYSWV